MAELIKKLQALKRLPEDEHLFCPRVGDDGSVYYEEDLAGMADGEDEDTMKMRRRKIKEADQRKWLALDALQILAFDGEDAEPHKAWLIDRLNAQMTSCDVCTRIFHKSRPELKHKLEEQFDEEEVAAFLQVVDGTSLKRIQAGLDTAQDVLLRADPKQRGVKILPNESTYAFFESLSCAALLKNEELLQRHFDSPFRLVQTKKRLKLQTFLPAMTEFLFSKNDIRQVWAYNSWTTFRRNLLGSEFEWAVREYLLEAMSRVQITCLDAEFVPAFWAGVRLIVDRLDKDLITHSLRALDLDLYKLCLEHLQLNSDGFMDLVATIGHLLEKSPTDFWDAMGAISPVVIVDQIFNSPILNRVLLQAQEGDEEALQNLKEVFAWITPFLASIKTSNLAPAIRALANQFLNRLQSDKFSRVSREYCYKEGMHVLDYAFRRCNEGKTRDTFVGQATATEFLNLLGPYVELIISGLDRSNSLQTPKEEQTLTLSMIQHAFTLECLALDIEREAILKEQPSPTGPAQSTPIWEAIIKAIDVQNLELPTRMLMAGKNLIGLEKFFVKPGAELKPNWKHFNQKYDMLSQSVTRTIERLSDFDPEQLDGLFDVPSSATAITATLFSSDIEARQGTVEFLKVISSEDERRDAIGHILKSFYHNSVRGFTESIRQLMRRRIFTPAPSMIKTLADVIDVMCNSQDGILRSRRLEPIDARVTMGLWQHLWNALTVIFKTTEDWSNMGYEKTEMMNFCRDTMQFADQLFDQCSIFATAIKESLAGQDSEEGSGALKELLGHPAKTMDGMAKWLRLRDEFLNRKSVGLISKLLRRLKNVSIDVDEDTLSYIERVLDGDVRNKLSLQEKAELQRAWEIYTRRSLTKKAEEEVAKTQKQQAQLNSWISGGTIPGAKTSETEHMKLVSDSSRAFESFKARREAIAAKTAEKTKKVADAKAAEQAEFKRKRELEKEAKKKRDMAAIAAAKKTSALRGWSEQTAEAGSGLEGLGVLGKDHAVKGEGMMVSSDESDDDDELDTELFGITKPKKSSSSKINIIDGTKIQQPVKKRRVQRSIKDMRARLAPDLSPLHRTILGWDYYHNGDFPPNSNPGIYSAVPDKIRSSFDYQQTFEPLLTLEAWQGFVKAREESSFKPYDIKIVARSSVDAFQEVSSTMTHVDNKELNISEGDVILLHKTKASSADDPHCLARVFRITRKKAHIEVAYRVMPGNPLSSSLNPNAIVYGMKIQSLTPLEREYGALLGLQYYDLCDEICQAKPSPLLKYSDEKLGPLINNYRVNKAQAKAVQSAIDNDAFTLIQGPPGSGKTKTIVAIVGAILTDNLRSHGTAINVPGKSQQQDSAPKKLLVCAPSNAAVDELVMRFKDGVKTLGGTHRKLNIVRLGRSDAINVNVTDVTLEELVNKKLNISSLSNGNGNGNLDGEATKKLFQEHQAISEHLRHVREQLDAGQTKGEEAVKLQDDFNALRRRKTQLGTQIDNAKDKEKIMSRETELNRRRAQESILGEAHVICATLSGSGHDMFQNLNIEFETVIVDEAAQCVEMSALIPLKYGCAKCILVGDPKQLPPTVFSKEAARFQYEQSLFVRMQGNHPDDVHLLDTQYRMHPDISVFPSRTFYDSRLLDGDDMAGLRQRPWHKSSLLAPYKFFDVQGQHQAAPRGHSLINIAEIDVAMQLFKRVTSDFGSEYDFQGKIGIITPYKSQLRELKNRFSQKYGQTIFDAVEFNTTDAFQGRESEIIIFSCVRASPAGGIGFLQDIRRMNVGLTRAKSSLWVLGNSQSLVRGEFWRKLVEDAQKRSSYVEGNVMSMLQKHSNSYPAPKAFRPKQEAPQIKSESGVKQESRMKPESKIKEEPTNGKPSFDNIPRRSSSSDAKPLNGNGKRKASSPPGSGEDVDMNDAPDIFPSESASESGRSTPFGIVSGDTRNSPMGETKEETGIKTENGKQELSTGGLGGMRGGASDVGGGLGAVATGPMSGMAKPKIIRKRPKEVDPFIKRQPPKKPKPS